MLAKKPVINASAIKILHRLLCMDEKGSSTTWLIKLGCSRQPAARIEKVQITHQRAPFEESGAGVRAS